MKLVKNLEIQMVWTISAGETGSNLILHGQNIGDISQFRKFQQIFFLGKVTRK